MKIYRLFLTVCTMAIAMNASAQSETTTQTTGKPLTENSASLSKGGDYDHRFHLMPEIKIGSTYGYAGFGANLVLEREFHKYLAWDLVSLDFSAPFDFNHGNIGLKTGLRAFTSRFWKEKVRGFMSVAAGWDCNIREHVEKDETKTWQDKDGNWQTGWTTFKNKGVSGLGVSVGIGLQIQKHVFIGYTMEYSTAAKFTSHYAKFGYRF